MTDQRQALRRDPEGVTRDEWLANNKAIMEGEHYTKVEVLINQIETRLHLHEDVRNESDERLGTAYIACLAQYEAEGEADDWAPLTVAHLVEHEGVTELEGAVIVLLTAMEYDNTITPE